MKSDPIDIVAILTLKCPKCREGKIYKSFLEVDKNCSVCGFNFHPEAGYYLGAMMASYFIGAFSAVPTLLAVKMSNLDPLPWMILLPSLQIAVLTPFVLRYSRVVWLHVEQNISGRLNKQDRPDQNVK